MSKGLEALDRLINEIEKDSRTVSFLFHNIETWEEDKELVKEELKALDIIKNKLVNVQALIHSCNLDEYNMLYIKALQLTQEEYEILKEALL